MLGAGKMVIRDEHAECCPNTSKYVAVSDFFFLHFYCENVFSRASINTCLFIVAQNF